ncbi:uncharacterized protein MONBRDRAFT_33267 [Monosiga brevicollis MX1]|uniref:Pep3/Vps18 beta-propeller domain-containing protein n=1 Tax=Monosiga brevicollis TaxID=81824 RepID=A9V4G1_MONBE|nr:uncharacterized protein MONBRDRAFT_33267 [Monosiga brevicollis MX1]EDQ87609.1 predicted protein [Monosiga brevicollis MX1]|eukprot:XP_001747529.1 hypothetical protein [Monosiga brevicollis MX1]
MAGRFSVYDYDDDLGGFGGIGAFGNRFNDFDDYQDDDAGAGGEIEEQPIFDKKSCFRDREERIVAVGAANDKLFIAQRPNTVGMYRPQVSSPEETFDVSDYLQTVSNLFVDPQGIHLIVCGETAEGNHTTVYVNTHTHQRTKCAPIRPLQSHRVTAVAWDPVFRDESSSHSGHVLVGTFDGAVYSVVFDGGVRDCESVWSFPQVRGRPSPICSLHVELLSGGELYVTVSSTHLLKQFMALPKANERHPYAFVFKHPLPNAEQEVMVPISRSQLVYHGRQGETASAFAWLTGQGLIVGNLDLELARTGNRSAIPSYDVLPYDVAFIDGDEVPRNLGEDRANPDSDPRNPQAIMLTQFHVLLLYPRALRILCTLNKHAIPGQTFRPAQGEMLNLVRDESNQKVYCFSNKAVFYIEAHNEERDVWRLYLERGNFYEAIEHAGGDAHKINQIRVAQAEALMADGAYTEAAHIYAKTNASFETVALKLLDQGPENYGALRNYLQQRLGQLADTEPTKIALLITWMIELYLTSLNAIRSSKGHDSADYARLFGELKEFLNRGICRTNLHKETVLDLMRGHGNVDALLFYAEQQQDFKEVIQHHIQMNNIDGAISVLKDQIDERPELLAMFAAHIIQHRPQELLDICHLNSRIDAGQLIPAFVRYQQQANCKAETLDAIRAYLEWVIERNPRSNESVYNYLVSLYVTLDQEQPLLRFLKEQEERPQFDRDYALRLCHEKNKLRACVELYSSMGMFEEAVQIALQVGSQQADAKLELATSIIERVKEEEADKIMSADLPKKLWSMVAEFTVKEICDVPLAMKVLEQSQVLKIEDILLFFPDFSRINEVQEHIQTSLQEYNNEIGNLNETMKAAQLSAKAIRGDIQALNQRYQVVTGNMSCGLCDYPLMSRAFYVVRFIKPSERKKVDRHQRDLKRAREDPNFRVDVVRLNREIDEIVGQDCSLCGEMAIRAIDEPFIPDELLPEYVESWSLGDLNVAQTFGMSEEDRERLELEEEQDGDADLLEDMDDFDPLGDLDV